VAALVLTAVLVLPTKTDALVDDFEQEFWLPFTHFNLGDRAFAGYADGTEIGSDIALRVPITLGVILPPLIVCVAVSVVAGLFPAYRASTVSPIEALRS